VERYAYRFARVVTHIKADSKRNQAPTDSDNDGIPDSYETGHGLNPNDPTDAVTIASNGYSSGLSLGLLYGTLLTVPRRHRKLREFIGVINSG
jgi:hypothetical protein